MTTARSREEILRKRAERLAAEASGGKVRRVALEVAVVGVGDMQVGLDVSDLREIVAAPEITPLPDLPPHLLGLTQVRGELLGVVDLGAVLGVNARPLILAVVEDSRGPFGLACQSVIGFRTLYEDEMATELATDPDRPFKAVTREMLALLDMSRLPAPESPR